MSRKDYELIAAAIHRSRMAKGLIRNSKEREAALAGIHLVALDLSSTLLRDNPDFNPELFLSATGFHP